jgi:hypothetical protein
MAYGSSRRSGSVSVAGLRDMMLSERAAEVELTERRVTPKPANIKTAIAFIQAHKLGGVQSTGACDRLLLH